MGKRHHPPWDSDEQLIQVLECERQALAAQIDALRAGRQEDADSQRDLVLVCRYIVMGSASRVADWANLKGWRLPGAPARGKRPANGPRQYRPCDISKIVEHRLGGLPAEIYELAYEVLQVGRSIPSD